MRWFVAGALALLLVWAAYVVSPFWALGDLAAAIESRDARRLAYRVNARALRLSLARQVIAEGLAQSGAPVRSDGQLAASLMAVAAEPYLSEIATPAGLLALLGDPAAPSDPAGSVIPVDMGRNAVRRIPALVRAARWRGFRNVYVSLPPDAPADQQAKFQLRLSRLSWRLVALDLPPATRRRLLESLLRQVR